MQFSVRVLGLHEGGEWCALALDMSLRGYGATSEEAVQDLSEAIEAQVSFAMEHDSLDNIWVPAAPHYVELYQQARRQGLRRYLEANDKPADAEAEYAAGDLPLPRAHHDGFEAVSA